MAEQGDIRFDSNLHHHDMGFRQPVKLVIERKRVEAFLQAQELVGPLVEAHGLVDQTMDVYPELSPRVVNVISAADQHIDLVLRVADWLLEG